jgi:hypothetical protein
MVFTGSKLFHSILRTLLFSQLLMNMWAIPSDSHHHRQSLVRKISLCDHIISTLQCLSTFLILVVLSYMVFVGTFFYFSKMLKANMGMLDARGINPKHIPRSWTSWLDSSYSGIRLRSITSH